MNRIALVLALAGCNDTTMKPAVASEQPARAATPAPTAPDVASASISVQATVGQVIKDYLGNEIAADAKYKGKVFRLVGLVDHVSGDGGGRAVVRFKASTEDGFRAEFSSARGLEAVKPMDTISARCIGDGMMGTQGRVRGCLFERVVPDSEPLP